MPDLSDQVFLSPMMSEVTAQIRNAHKKIFTLVDKINQLTNREILATEILNNDEQHLVVACLLHRALTTYQGVVVLVERGMPSEAKVLLRTQLEVMFQLVAITKDREVGRAYILQDEVHRKKFINKFKLLSDPVKASVGNPVLEDLLATIDQRIHDGDIRKCTTEWFAERAELLDFYHSAYSVFSRTVHAHVRDLETALIVDTQGKVTGFAYGPTDAGLEEIVLTAIESFLFSVQGAFSVLPSDSHAAFSAIHDEFVTLSLEVFPDAKM